MVILIFKEDIVKEKELIEDTLLNNGVIIYPTDTLYGLGCRADKDLAVNKIYEIKDREQNKPLSILVPDYNFISKNFITNNFEEKIIKSYLPGPYTILLTPNKDIKISKKINLNIEKVGIRICDHYIQDIIYSLQIPITATSANISGQKSISKFEDLPIELLKKVDLIIIDDSKLSGKSSNLIDIVDDKIIKIR